MDAGIRRDIGKHQRGIASETARGDTLKAQEFFNDQVNKQPRQKELEAKKHRLQQDKQLCEAVQSEEKHYLQNFTQNPSIKPANIIRYIWSSPRSISNLSLIHI